MHYVLFNFIKQGQEIKCSTCVFYIMYYGSYSFFIEKNHPTTKRQNHSSSLTYTSWIIQKKETQQAESLFNKIKYSINYPFDSPDFSFLDFCLCVKVNRDVASSKSAIKVSPSFTPRFKISSANGSSKYF